MNQAVLLLGGNIGDRMSIVNAAIVQIKKQCGKTINHSKVYESEAWGFKADTNFLNQAIVINTNLKANELLCITQSIEAELGRKERISANYESRSIDIDILFYNSEIIESKNLIIPHPRLHLRKFTLNCLSDIDSNFIHPKLNKSIKKLSQECKDTVKVWPYE